MKAKFYIIALILTMAVFGMANADWYYGDFQNGTDGWFTDALNNVTVSSLSSAAYPGSNGSLFWALTFTGVTSSGDVACAPRGNFGWNFTPETTVQVKLALTGSVASTEVMIYTKSSTTWGSAPYVWQWQNCDGNFVIYNLAVDSTYVIAPQQTSFPVIVQIRNIGVGVVTCYMDYAKSFGSLEQAPPDIYADFTYDFEPAWIVNWDGNAVQGHAVGQNGTGLTIDSTLGTLSWVDLNTTSSGANIGASVSSNWGSSVSWAPYEFIELRVKISTTGQVGAEKAIGGQVFAQGPWNANAIEEGLPIDDQFHTYSLSKNTTQAQTYNQIGLDLNGHGDSDVLVTIDYVKFKYSGSPLIYAGVDIAKAYTDPANTIYVLSNVPQEFSVSRGLAPFTWSITSVSGSPGQLDSYSGATVNFTSSGGISYLTITDAEGRSFRTANIVVTPTSAPLAVDPEVLDYRPVVKE